MALLPRAPVASGRFAPGAYHTDGSRLLRMLNAGAEREFWAVEDCRTLDVGLVSLVELESKGPRPIGAGSTASGDGTTGCR
jgi:hypothetical protein